MTDIVIDRSHARTFLLGHLHLLPPRKLSGAQGVMDFVRHVNCIQYDPIDIVGQNVHLVLQARIRSYRRSILDTLLYEERKLIDGFDKQMSIFPTEDWPAFRYYRRQMAKKYMESKRTAAAAALVARVRKEIGRRGPLSSIDFEDDTKMDWWLTGEVRAARIAMDILFYGGDTVVHHRVGTRRYFDLAKRTLPRTNSRAVSFGSHEDYLEWHVYRRTGGIGLLDQVVGAEFGGLVGWQGGRIRAAMERLVGKGKLVRISVEDAKRSTLYLRAADVAALRAAESLRYRRAAAFIGPLDNLMWDRSLVRTLFGFEYTWEVYLPAAKRRYGYYVLPVLYGDRFVARAEPIFDRSSRSLVIENWWWEDGVDTRDDEMLSAIEECLTAFARYLGATQIRAGKGIVSRHALRATLRKADAAM